VTKVRQLCTNFAHALEGERVFAIVAVMVIRTLIDRARRLARRGLKWIPGRRYTSAVDDLFSVPLGYVDPDQGPDNELSLPAVPPAAFEYPGKHVALRGQKIVAIADTYEELLETLGDKHSKLLLFHVPASRVFAR
jgi:hypothetical protein